MSKTFIKIAQIGTTFRLNGQLNLYTLASPVETLLSYGNWYIKMPNSKDWHILRDESVYRIGSKIYIKIANIDDVDTAKKYINSFIGVLKSSLPKLDNGETYFVDIIGCEVLNQDNKSFGKIIDIIETGSNEVLVCSNGSEEYLIPYVQQYIIDEIIDSKKIVVDWEFNYLS